MANLTRALDLSPKDSQLIKVYMYIYLCIYI